MGSSKYLHSLGMNKPSDTVGLLACSFLYKNVTFESCPVLVEISIILSTTSFTVSMCDMISIVLNVFVKLRNRDVHASTFDASRAPKPSSMISMSDLGKLETLTRAVRIAREDIIFSIPLQHSISLLESP